MRRIALAATVLFGSCSQPPAAQTTAHTAVTASAIPDGAIQRTSTRPRRAVSRRSGSATPPLRPSLGVHWRSTREAREARFSEITASASIRQSIAEVGDMQLTRVVGIGLDDKIPFHHIRADAGDVEMNVDPTWMICDGSYTRRDPLIVAAGDQIRQ